MVPESRKIEFSLSMRLVLDSKTLNKCLTTDEDNLLDSIKRICDVICLTKKIKKEYQKPPNYLSGLLVELERLKYHRPKKLEQPNLGPIPEISGIRASHRAFIEEAIRINATYFITEKTDWLHSSSRIMNSHRLKIVTPAQYIRERS